MQWTSGHLSWPALCLLLLLCPSVWVLPLFHFILVPEAASPNYIFSAPVMAHDSAHLSECLSPYRYWVLVQNWAISWRRDNQSRFWNSYGCRGWRNGLIFLGLLLIMPGETGPSCDLLWYQVKRHYIRIKPTQRKVEMKNIKRERENPGFIFRTSRSSYT